jgi:hypothetical protein
MKQKIKIVEHGKQWVDPNPAPVMICPECGGEKLVDTFNWDNYYKDFLLFHIERKSICKRCEGCNCMFEIGSKNIVKTRPVWIAFTIFAISLIVLLEALEKLYFNQDMKITAIENKLDEGGKVEVNVRYR